MSRTPGPVKLLLPDLGAVQKQLQQLETRLKGTKFQVDFTPDLRQATVVDPWGQRFCISEKLSYNGNINQKGSFEGLLLPCHLGTARAIAQFYKTMLRVRTTIDLTCLQVCTDFAS